MINFQVKTNNNKKIIIIRSTRKIRSVLLLRSFFYIPVYSWKKNLENFYLRNVNWVKLARS